ncbi:hypothetical protein [Streptomyces sp. NBRC 109706]|uniref:hypothetical protein n=1 Tax=Streptomyces sp. NBRC 109706 TaxID=1550035 RepID=UPI000781F5C2|nr:hypothetical protein [Streptomyces sp. NBRC 109706]
MSEEREVPLVPDGPVELEPQPLAIIEPAAQRAALVAELERAGVALGAYERGTVDWLCQRPGWGTVATIASWVRRAAGADVPALLAELAARPSRADVLREAAVQMDEICEQHGVLGVGDRLRRLADKTDADGGAL